MWKQIAAVYLIAWLFPNHFWFMLGLIAIVAFWWTSHGMGIRQKLAVATWKPQKDAAMTANVTVDMTNALDYIAQKQAEGIKLTPTILVGKAVGLSVATIPHANGRVVLGRFVPREQVDISFLVAVPESKNLGYTTVRNMPSLSLKQVADLFQSNAQKVRAGTDENFKKNMDLARMLPTIIIGPLVQFLGFITNCLGLPYFEPLGLVPHAFGSFVITSIGMLGFEEAYAPFTPFFHTTGLATVCAIKRKPIVVEGDKIEARDVMNVTFTVDHRHVDAFEASKFLRKFEQCMADPRLME